MATRKKRTPKTYKLTVQLTKQDEEQLFAAARARDVPATQLIREYIRNLQPNGREAT